MKAADIEGKTVVLTGKFSEIKRKDAESALSRLGASIGSGVTKKTDILFVGERAGSKLKKAQGLGIQIADEATLVALLAQAPEPSADSDSDSDDTPSTGQAQVEAFKDKVIALTGTFTTMKRSAAKKILVEAGAKVGSGVTKKTELLIYGDNAGSKLDKAHEYGVTLMTEAEMVALLTAGGQGAAQLADAGEKLKKKAAEDAANANPEMQKVIAELRSFVAALKKRKDIRVSIAKLGRKAGKSKLRQLEGAGMPRELLDFYAEMDGAHVEWSFIEPPGGGCMRIPPVSQWTRFTGDDDHYMDFGEDREAVLFDEITPEGATWLVRSKGSESASLIFASAAEGADGVYPADSIIDYLRKTMKNGFVGYWPRCFSPSPYVSYSEWEATIERFQAGPVKPAKIKVGGRVHVSYFSEGGRGEVLSKHTAPESSATDFPGREFLEVQLDAGGTAYFPAKWSKGWSTVDAYERLRAPDFAWLDAVKADAPALLDDLARAIMPPSHTTNYPFGALASNARLGAGVLGARPFAEAAGLVADLHAALVSAKVDLEATRKIEKNGEEFNGPEFSRLRFQYSASGLFRGLCDGLRVLAHHASAEGSVAPSELIAAELRERLAKVPSGSSLAELLGGSEVLTAIRWSNGDQSEEVAALGLPEGACMLSGSGY